MEMKRQYTAPAVIDDLALELENRILRTSVVDSIEEVDTMGQEINDLGDLSDPSSSFNHTWED